MRARLAALLVMRAGFILTALAFGLLACRWTGGWSAAFVAASAAGFNSHLFTRMGRLQAMHVEFIALALFGLDQVFTRMRIRDAVTLGVGFALPGLTSIYLLAFTTWATIFAGLSRLFTARPGRRMRPAWLERRWGGRRGWWAVAAMTVLLISAEALTSPFPFRRFDGIPKVFDALRSEGRDVVAELPMYDRLAAFGNATYMLNSRRLAS